MALETSLLPPTRLGSTARLDRTKNLFRVDWTDAPDCDPRKIDTIRDYINNKMTVMLRHRYFWACRSCAITREQLLSVLKQLYCFSIYYERLLTMRVSRYSSTMNREILEAARDHLKEEMGHADLLTHCILNNGVQPEELQHIAPKAFTKAVFGYLMVTVEYENEFVTNIAIMQVMETIGMYFYEATLQAMQAHGFECSAFKKHADDGVENSTMGMELYAYLDEQSMSDGKRIIDDLFHMMRFMLDEWMND
jgi:hypothetical protein